MKKLFVVTLAVLLVGLFSSLPLYAEPKDENPEVSWRIQAAFPPAGAVTFKGVTLEGSIKTFRRAFENIAQKTGGKFKITLYEPGVLVGPRDYYSALKSGALEGIYGFGWYYSRIPVGKIDPGIFFLTSDAKVYAKLIFEDDQWFKIVREAYAKHNMYYFSPQAWGGQVFLTNFPIRSMADFQGKLFRGAGPISDMLKLFGAKVTFISTGEAYTALQRGTIDGWGYSFAAAGLSGNMEVTKYVSLPSYFNPVITSLVFNMDAWKKLPDNYKKILTDELMRHAKWSFDVANDLLDQWALEVAAPKYGAEVIRLSDEAYEEMKKTQLPLWEKYAAGDEYATQLYNLIKNAAEKAKK